MWIVLLFISVVYSTVLIQQGENQVEAFIVLGRNDRPWEILEYEGFPVLGNVGDVPYCNISNLFIPLVLDMVDLGVPVGKLQDLGAEAVVIVDFGLYPGREVVFRASSIGAIPVAYVSMTAFDFLTNLDDEKVVTFTVNQIDENQWRMNMVVALVLHVFLVLTGIAPLYLSGSKLYLFISSSGFTQRTALVCLCMNLIGDILREIHFIHDPFAMKVFGFNFPFIFFSTPFITSTALLIVLYWEESLRPSSTMNVSSFLSVFHVPFIVVVIISFVISTICLILFFTITSAAILLVIFTNILLYAFLSILYCVVSQKLIKTLSVVKERSAKLDAMVKIITAAGILLILSIPSDISIIISQTGMMPVLLEIVLYTIRFLIFHSLSFTFSLIFVPQGFKTTRTMAQSKSKNSRIQEN